MTIAGWIFLLLSWTLILGMVAVCVARVAGKKQDG